MDLAQVTYTTSGVGAGAIVLWVVVFYAIAVIPYWVVFTKAGQPGWPALIPIYSTYILLKVIGRPGWWLLLFLVPLVNIVDPDHHHERPVEELRSRRRVHARPDLPLVDLPLHPGVRELDVPRPRRRNGGPGDTAASASDADGIARDDPGGAPRTIGYASAPMDMARLLTLQEIDTAIDRLSARKEVLESGGELAAARNQADAAERALGELRLQLDVVGRDQSKLEHEIDSLTQKAAAEEKRLYDGSVVNAKELEIDPARDREPQAETIRSRGRDARAHGGARGAGTPGGGGTSDVRRAPRAGPSRSVARPSRSSRRSRPSSRRSVPNARRVVPDVEPDVLELYEDLRKQKKGIGVAALVDGVCQGCHEQLSAMELDKVKRVEGVRRCEHCRRILVF